MININGILTNVEPTYKVKRLIKGTEHPIQDGSYAYDVTKVTFEIELNYSYLYQTEFNQLEALLHAEGNTSGVIVTLTLNERIFDGATVDPVLNRVLNKMRIINSDEEPMRPYCDDNTFRSLKLILRET